MAAVLDEDKGSTEKTIIWCHHVPELKWAEAALAANGVKHVVYYGAVSDEERKAADYAYNNDPEVRVMLATQATGGVGNNWLGYDSKSPTPIDCNTTEEIFLSQGWSAILREQAEDRGHRKGCRVPVTITTILVPGSIDVQIDQRLRAKKDMALEVQDVKSLLAALLGDAPE